MQEWLEKVSCFERSSDRPVCSLANHFVCGVWYRAHRDSKLETFLSEGLGLASSQSPVYPDLLLIGVRRIV